MTDETIRQFKSADEKKLYNKYKDRDFHTEALAASAKLKFIEKLLADENVGGLTLTSDEAWGIAYILRDTSGLLDALTETEVLDSHWMSRGAA